MSDVKNTVTPFQKSASSDAAIPVTDAATRNFALALAAAADERKGADIRILKVDGVSFIADYFVVVTGFSSAQVRAIARSINDTAAADFERQPLRTEGQGDSSWVLQDYGEVIVHIFMPDERDYYDLEAFWGHAEEIPFAAES
ncbi:ribosome silencing factor [Leptolyngbya iicbica]|uniref:Ribosomal silencing factor RsfS n=2 Tax=Cyanophyceae TaxID=3028117 RepID=A0A4Q7E9U4_9CYAN|nr:ribosome silencing factor [Leptolyngbya sp. LK]RZM79647.1 ribosome silencing factor [Leptolyngbya sp. LK]